jgi:hypothetical protein
MGRMTAATDRVEFGIPGACYTLEGSWIDEARLGLIASCMLIGWQAIRHAP